jgi:hypothetical protein
MGIDTGKARCNEETCSGRSDCVGRSLSRRFRRLRARAILAILDLLTAPTPGHIRGIAKMSWLLSDGTGPVYNRREALGLAEALRDVTTFLTSSEV